MIRYGGYLYSYDGTNIIEDPDEDYEDLEDEDEYDEE